MQSILSTRSRFITTLCAAALTLVPVSAHAITLFNNGVAAGGGGAFGITSGIGNGFGGADTSSFLAPVNTFGIGTNVTAVQSADDFIVPASGWNVDGFTVYGYSTSTYPNPPSASPFPAITATVYSGTPGAGGTVVATSTNLTSSAWTGIYRTSSTTLTNAQRPVFSATVSFPTLSLAQGTYWIAYSLTGAAPGAAGSVFSPQVTTSTQGTPVGNTRQFTISTGTWADVAEGGSGQNVALPFLVSGTVPTVVPEANAGILALLALPIMGFVAARRRK